MSRRMIGILGLVIACSGLSCAGPNKLAQQSEKEYSEGNLEKAYQKAARALRKEPDNRRARAAMTQAASQLRDERETEIRGMAAQDTVAAAKRCLAMDQFRAELIDFRVILPPHPEFDRDEAAIRSGAAHRIYAQAVEDLESGTPKRAYDEFKEAQDYEPRDRNIAKRMQEAYGDALPRVAFLPFSNETDLPVLGKGFADKAYAEIAHRIANSGFRFTELAPREQVYGAIPMSAMDHLGPREAARIGRDLGVDRVILGRFSGMRSRTNTGAFPQTVYRKTVDKDENGAARERYAEKVMLVLTRDRDVTVDYEYSIVDVRDASEVAGNSGTIHASAHAIYTSAGLFGDDDPASYALLSPDQEKSDPVHARQVRQDWQDRCGDWSLSEVIARSRKEHARPYESRYQDDWVLRSNMKAFFLGDLPPEGELVKYAFGQVWEPLTRTLHDLDEAEPGAVPHP